MGREPQTESHTPPSLLSSVLPPFLPPSLADTHLNAFPPRSQLRLHSHLACPFAFWRRLRRLLQSDWLTAMRREARRVCQPIFSLGIKIDLLKFFFFSFCTVKWNGWGGGKMSPGLYFDLYVNEPRKRNWIFTLSHRGFFFIILFFFTQWGETAILALLDDVYIRLVCYDFFLTHHFLPFF